MSDDAFYVLLAVNDSRMRGWLMWWASNRNGLTFDIRQAGLYAKFDADNLSYNGGSITGRHDIAIPEIELAKLTRNGSGQVYSRDYLRDLVTRFPAKHAPAKYTTEDKPK